jgi:septal ring factor EnvC (AmiA/AmiB activator)
MRLSTRLEDAEREASNLREASIRSGNALYEARAQAATLQIALDFAGSELQSARAQADALAAVLRAIGEREWVVNYSMGGPTTIVVSIEALP